METLPETSLRPTLPGEAYTSPDVYERERERIFARSWLCGARADTVAEPGRPYVADVAGESVIVVRDRSSALHGHLNVCRHRGARVCPDGASGPVGHLRCPYHAWTYGLDGRLVAAPNSKEMPDLDKERHSLASVAVATWCGYLWVCLDPNAPPLETQVAPQLVGRLGSTDVLDAYGLDHLAVGHTEVYEVAANWKSLIENFTECYHCPTIHPQLTAAVPEFSSGYGSITGGRWHGAALAEELEAFSVSGKAVRPPLPGLSDEEQRRRFFGVILLPNAFVILVPDHVAFMRVEPLGADRSRVTCDWLFDPEEVGAPGFDPSDAVALLDVTNRQDWEACESCHRNARSRAFVEGGVLVPSEHLIVDFHRYLSGALGPAQED